MYLYKLKPAFKKHQVSIQANFCGSLDSCAMFLDNKT